MSSFGGYDYTTNNGKAQDYLAGAVIVDTIAKDNWNPERVIMLLVPNVDTLPCLPSSLVSTDFYSN